MRWPGDSPAIDLQAELAEFVGDKDRSKLDADAVMNCYEPLSGPELGRARPSKVDIRSDADALMPFHGTIVVRSAG